MMWNLDDSSSGSLCVCVCVRAVRACCCFTSKLVPISAQYLLTPVLLVGSYDRGRTRSQAIGYLHQYCCTQKGIITRNGPRETWLNTQHCM